MPKLEDTMECYEQCPRKEQFIREEREDISLDEVNKLYKFLQGELPENITMKFPPKLSKKQAFSIIWFLQEEMNLLPDKYAQCRAKGCGDLYDSDSEGCIAMRCESHTCYKDISCEDCRKYKRLFG